ncbi:MAG: hypothetical protein SGI87_01685 [Flavobacteriales bacterium]|nr:hypothetical protein [Flavobacteriales bacterium]
MPIFIPNIYWLKQCIATFITILIQFNSFAQIELNLADTNSLYYIEISGRIFGSDDTKTENILNNATLDLCFLQPK